jgi:hypothetical protein
MQPGRKTLCVRRYIAEEMEGKTRKGKRRKKEKKYVRRFSYAKSRILYIVIVEIVFERERERENIALGFIFPPFFSSLNLPERTVWNDGIESDLHEKKKKNREKIPSRPWLNNTLMKRRRRRRRREKKWKLLLL